MTELEPVSAHETVKRPDSNEWIAAIVDELKSLLDNEAFSVVKKPYD